MSSFSHLLRVTNFIGRENETEQVLDLLGKPDCRLITLVGSGGIGKSRLSLDILTRASHLFPDGLFFIPLESLKTQNQILFAIQEYLQINIHHNRDYQKQIQEYIDEKESLLILDNFESAIGEVSLIEDILLNTRKVKLLVTSRLPLGLQDEWIRRIEGLSFPQNNLSSIEDAQHYAALQFFIEKAAQAGHPVQTLEQLNSAAQICRLVGGVPLAIEMVASWLQFFEPADIALQLEKNTDLLSSRVHNIPDRHRSMRTVFEESWNLLPDEEKEFLVSLSVFNGCFRAESVQEMYGIDLRTLSNLVDKSLVQTAQDNRFRLHEMVRVFAQEKLTAQPHKFAEKNERFCLYFSMKVQKHEPNLKGARQREGLDEIEKEFQNIQSAWYLAVDRKDYTNIDKMLIGLNFFCFMRGYLSAYHEMVNAAIERLAPQGSEEPHRMWAKLLSWQDFSAYYDQKTLHQVQTSLQIAQQENNTENTARALFALGRVASEQGDLNKGLEYYQQSLKQYQKFGDLFYIAFIYSLIGRLQLSLGQFDRAAINLEKCLAISQQNGNQRSEAYCFEHLAISYFNLGEFAKAYQNHLKANHIYSNLDMRPALAYSEVKLGSYALFNGDFLEARQRCARASHLAKKIENSEIELFAQTCTGVLECLETENYAAGQLLIQPHPQPISDSCFSFISNWGSSLASWGLGNYQASKQAIRQALCLMLETKNIPMQLFCFPIFAALMIEEGRYKQATELLATAREHPLNPNKWMEKALFIRGLDSRLQKNLPRSEFRQIRQSENPRDFDTLIKDVLDFSSPDLYLKAKAVVTPIEDTPFSYGSQVLEEPLTDRELEVVGFLASGYSNRQIASYLTISLGTAKTHIHNIYSKLAVSNRVQAIKKLKELFLL